MKSKKLSFKTTLGKKLTLLYLLLIISSFAFIQYKGYDYIYSQVENETKENLIRTSSTLISSHFSLRSYSRSNIQNLAMHLRMTSELSNCRIIVIYDNRDIILDTANANLTDTIYNGNKKFLFQTATTNYDMGGYLAEPSLCISMSIAGENHANGHIVFAQGNSVIQKRADYYFNLLMMLFYFIVALLGLVFAGIYICAFLPLRRLRIGVKDFSIGKENHPISIHSNDEYGELADTLNIIGDELSKFDEYQRKFISNISHDFRSPLTSIRGYVQAMVDGVIPPESQQKYLDIILFETDRLTKLTSNLLDVNNFDKDNIFLDISRFNLHDSIRKTAGALEGVAAKKDIRFDLELSDTEPLWVSGDKDKIQQVLHNLVDNAVKFSHEGSSILISTREKGNRVFVSVKDSGIGIPKDDLGKIFERFYKTDLSRGKDKLGTGLGLSICKEIITAHKQNLDVVSTEGVGSEFVFTLTKETE